MGKRYDSQAVRDLVWAFETPSMVDHPLAVTAEEGAADLARNQGILGMFDKTGSDLHNAVRDRKSDRLGEYFEILVTAWMKALAPVALLGSNEQVKGPRGTIGEFDLIFARDNAFHHWELAIKFYLGHPGRNGESLWFGPNPVDRLDRKWRKMKERQMQLGQTRDGRAHLERLGVPPDEEVIPAAFLKGYLFEPLDAQFAVERMPETSQWVPTGWWVHRSEFATFQQELERGEKMRWVRLPRLQWMAPARLDDRKKSRSFGPFEHRLGRSKPALVAGLVDGDEVTRGFIVPDRWPNG